VSPQRYRIVVMAASVGGIQAISKILGDLPAAFPVPLAIVQHRGSSSVSALAEILGRSGVLRVKDAENAERIERGCIYLAPGGVHFSVRADQTVALAATARVRFTRPSADVLFKSAADVYGSDVLAVVLTGSGNDGADGALHVKNAGGTVIAQDQESSQDFSMPAAAIAKGAVDYILPLESIGQRLIELTTNR
jgi:two-component system chemotaxis response regulator CheB